MANENPLNQNNLQRCTFFDGMTNQVIHFRSDGEVEFASPEVVIARKLTHDGFFDLRIFDAPHSSQRETPARFTYTHGCFGAVEPGGEPFGIGITFLSGGYGKMSMGSTRPEFASGRHFREHHRFHKRFLRDMSDEPNEQRATIKIGKFGRLVLTPPKDAPRR